MICKKFLFNNYVTCKQNTSKLSISKKKYFNYFFNVQNLKHINNTFFQTNNSI